jgi:hypothetical protein
VWGFESPRSHQSSSPVSTVDETAERLFWLLGNGSGVSRSRRNAIPARGATGGALRFPRPSPSALHVRGLRTTSGLGTSERGTHRVQRGRQPAFALARDRTGLRPSRWPNDGGSPRAPRTRRIYIYARQSRELRCRSSPACFLRDHNAHPLYAICLVRHRRARRADRARPRAPSKRRSTKLDAFLRCRGFIRSA